MSAKTEDRKLRGLFVIKADKPFDETHPLWDTVYAYKKYLEEVHVLVFSKTKIPHGHVSTSPEQDFFLYQCTSSNLLFRFWNTWKLLAFNLYWQQVFRADFILSFSPGRSGLFGYILSRYFRRPFFIVGSRRMIRGTAFSLKRKIARILFKRTTLLFVPGSQNALTLSKLLAIPPSRLAVLQPPVDMVTIAHVHEKKDYHLLHPQYNFFIAAVATDKDMLRALMIIHSRIVGQYPRCALIVIAPRSRTPKIRRFAKKEKGRGVFVYEHDDEFLTKLAGANAYLDVQQTEDTNTMLLYALGIGLPSVAYRIGTAEEIFTGSRYEHFACSPGDSESAVKLLLELIEHQAVRNDYAVNAGLVFKRFSARDTATYVKEMFELIEPIVRPPKSGVSAEKMYLKGLEKMRSEK